MEKKHSVLMHFMKNDGFELNQYLNYLLEQSNQDRQKQFGKYKIRKLIARN